MKPSMAFHGSYIPMPFGKFSLSTPEALRTRPINP